MVVLLISTIKNSPGDSNENPKLKTKTINPHVKYAKVYIRILHNYDIYIRFYHMCFYGNDLRQWLFVRYRTNSNLQYIGYSSGTGRLASKAICPVPDE